MKKLIFLSLFSIFAFILSAQNKSISDPKIHKEILIGMVDSNAFRLDLCKNWFAPEFNSYQSNKKTIRQLNKYSFEDIRIELIFGSWCHDSHREVPRMMKLLQEIHFPQEQIWMNAVSTKKESPDYDSKAHNIERVPTIIVYQNQLELGRIIESPNKSLEKDLLKILKNQQ